MANSINVKITQGAWQLATSVSGGALFNPDAFSVEIIESNTAPSEELKGITISSNKGRNFALATGQSIYARSLQDVTLVVTPE